MAIPVILPRQGQSVESCIISTWNKKVGDPVEIGDVLFSYETDKASFEEESKVSGTFLGVFFEEGDDVPCLLNVCAIGEMGEDISSFDPNANAEIEPSAEIESAPANNLQTLDVAVSSAPTVAVSNAGAFASPRAKNKAQELHLDYTFATGTGPKNRIIERDVLALASSSARSTAAALGGISGKTDLPLGTGLGGRISTQDLEATATSPNAAAVDAGSPIQSAYQDIKLTNIRKAIAKNMLSSLNNSAQLTHHVSFDASNIMAFRKQLKASAESLNMPNITLNDIILYAVSRALVAHADMNAHYLADQNCIRQFSNANLGIAVDTERGLMVPTLFGAESLSLSQISERAKSLAKQAQSGSIAPDLLAGGTFTISNLGSLDIEMFTPVLNPPQVGLLGVNTIIQRPREVNGEIKLYPAMGLSLTYDHRAIDGAPASRFLKTLKAYLENFTLLLAK